MQKKKFLEIAPTEAMGVLTNFFFFYLLRNVINGNKLRFFAREFAILNW